MQLVKTAVVALALVVGACSGAPPTKAPPPPRAVSVLTIQPSPVRDTSEYLGTLTSRQRVNVQPQVGGYVRKILVRPGQQVKTGAPLVEVDARQESAALESAQAQQQMVESGRELAKQTLARTQALFEEGLVSAQELDAARAAVDTSEASAQSARAQVSLRKVQLQYYAVNAPISGTVGDVLVRVGDYVTAQTVLTTVAQADALEIGIAVPAERARGVQVGTPIELLDSRGVATATVSTYFVAPEVDPRTQMVEVKAAFSNALGLRPSEIVRARVVYGERTALQVPALAVVRQSGQAFVFIVQDKDGALTVARKPVTLGALGATSYVIEKGLSEGDRVATSSLQALRDGAAVTIKDAR